MPPKGAKTANFAKISSKRAAPEKPTPTRQSKRVKAAAKTYAELDSDEDITDSNRPSAGASEDEYNEDVIKDKSSESEDQVEEDSEEEPKPRRGTSKRRPAKRTSLPIHKKQASEMDLWKDGAKLAPGTQLVIKKPKARDAGDTPYTDNTIHPNTMLFLEELAANNNRQWLKSTSTGYFRFCRLPVSGVIEGGPEL